MGAGKIILEGTIKLLSPALIGSGRDNLSDCDIVIDSEGRPLIPATSFIGVLRHGIIPPGLSQDQLKQFWGFSDRDKGQQSRILCSDLLCRTEKPMVSIRDGIKIDRATGVVEKKNGKGKKYDYQIVEKGNEFVLKMEIDFTNEGQDFTRQMACTICAVLKSGNMRIGAKTNSGLGKIVLKEEKIHEYDFKEKKDVLAWLRHSDGRSLEDISPFAFKEDEFRIDATLRLRSAFIIRSYSENPFDPDVFSMKSGSDFVITGASLRGALRSRAERILKTIGKPETIVHNLFGMVDEANPGNPAKKGRILVEEALLAGCEPELQNRVKIDRFTGGVMSGALFDSMPLFRKENDTATVCITVKDYRDHEHEAGLLLLLLKDLWTGDLAVGGEKNIGRGVFDGVGAKISWRGKTVSIDHEMKGLTDDIRKSLQAFVDSLNTYSGGGN